jgi:broad specificity phosphatase PhoE
VKFFLVRHGETEWNKLGRFQGHTDISLNERGLSQARETAKASSEWGLCAIYSSPLIRTAQVAEEIAKVTAMPVSKQPGLKELSLGDLEGVTGEDMRNNWPEVFSAWRSNPEKVSMPNGESLVQLRERCWQAILDIEQKHSADDSVTVISHNFAIRSIVGELLGVPLEHFHRMSLDLASVCTFDSDERGRRLTGYNSTGHLSPENR